MSSGRWRSPRSAARSVPGSRRTRAGTSASRCCAQAGCGRDRARSLIGIPAQRRRTHPRRSRPSRSRPRVLYWLLNPEFFDWLPRGRFDRDPHALRHDHDRSQMSFYFLTVASSRWRSRWRTASGAADRSRARSRCARTHGVRRRYGINSLRTMLAGFAMSGFLAAIAGVLFVHHQHMISQDIANNPFSAEREPARVRDRRHRRHGVRARRDPRRDLRVRDAVLHARPSGASSRPVSACSRSSSSCPGGLGAGLAEARGGSCGGSHGAAASSCRACSRIGVTTASS